jgi:hypothetical protein
MPAHSSISDLSPVSRKMWPVELCSDLVQQDADTFRLGTGGRQGENFLQLPAKMRSRHRFPKGSDLGFFEFALVRRQGPTVKTILLRRQFHPEYRFVREHGCESVPFAISRRAGRASPFTPFGPKTSDASFCSVHHTGRARVVKLTAVYLLAVFFDEACSNSLILSESFSIEPARQRHLQIRATRSAGTAARELPLRARAMNYGARVRMCRHKPARAGVEKYLPI